MAELKKELENKFFVLNWKDINKYLTEGYKEKLFAIGKAIEFGRQDDGKKMNNYYVCNQDEPYAQAVIDIILTDGKWIEQKIDEACKKQRKICADTYTEERGFLAYSQIATKILNSPSPKESEL